MDIQLNTLNKIGTNHSPYIIAEIGSNHNGKFELCKKMIDAAKNSGANCVKFQSFTKNSIFSKKVYEDNYFIADDYRNRTDFTLEKIVDAYSLKQADLLKIREYCEKVKIDFACTPFSLDEVDFLDRVINVDFFKIASMDCNNYEFIEYISRKNKPTILSTGLSHQHEIDKAIKAFESTGNKKLIIMHCVSLYPPEDTQVNLNKILTLKNLYPYPIGFSDHSLGIEMPIASIALGARVIEKHFTIDKKMEGWDHHMSVDEDEMKKIVNGCKKIFDGLGSEKIIRIESQERVDSFRRSIVTKQKISKGTMIQRSMLDVKRPGTGLSPEKIKDILGKKVLRDIGEDEILKEEDF